VTAVRRTIDLLASGRLAVALLAILAGLLFLYLFIPQFGPGETAQLDHWVQRTGAAAELSRALGLNGIRNSWWLLGSVSLLLVNLSVCMARRVPAAIRALRVVDPPPESFREWPRRRIGGPAGNLDPIAPALRRWGFRVQESAATMYGVRGRQAILGHWLFHAGLALLIGGGSLAAIRPDPFRGAIGIGEGESFRLTEASWLSTTTPTAGEMPELEFRLERVHTGTSGDRVLEFDAFLSTPEEGEVRIGINRPYRHRPYQVMAHGFGFMPGWAIVDARGRMLRGAWVKLVPFPLQQEESFPIGPRTSKVHVLFHPDGRGGNGQPVPETDEPYGGGKPGPEPDKTEPVFQTRIVLRGETIFDGMLAPDERVPIGGGREFFFLPEIRRYVLADVIEEKGHAITFAAFAIMIVGLGLRYGRLRKEVVVRSGPEGLELFGRAELFPHLFGEEMDRLAADLATRPERKDRRRAAA
jgi:hypothetical protein